MSNAEQVVEEKVKKEKVAPPTPSPIAVERGALVPSDASELNRTLTAISTGGGFPERFKTPEARMAAYNLAQSLMGSRWQLCLNNIAVIKGQMSIYGELPGALAEQTKEVQEKEVYCVDKEFKKICLENKNLDAEPYAGVCKIQRKGRVMKEFTYTIEEAKKAGQYPPMKAEWQNNNRTGNLILNEDSPWFKFLKVMLMRKAMNLGVKFEFADAMIGVPVAEYDFDIAPDLPGTQRDVSPPNTELADRINREYSDEEPKSEAVQ